LGISLFFGDTLRETTMLTPRTIDALIRLLEERMDSMVIEDRDDRNALKELRQAKTELQAFALEMPKDGRSPASSPAPACRSFGALSMLTRTV